MNNPTITKTADISFPKGEIVHWITPIPCAGISLRSVYNPTVIIPADPTDAITFEASFDGKTWAVIRDKENEVVRITKAGAYRLPVSVSWLRPVCRGEATIMTFIGKGF
jgi:hypothetical protein